MFYFAMGLTIIAVGMVIAGHIRTRNMEVPYWDSLRLLIYIPGVVLGVMSAVLWMFVIHYVVGLVVIGFIALAMCGLFVTMVR